MAYLIKKNKKQTSRLIQNLPSCSWTCSIISNNIIADIGRYEHALNRIYFPLSFHAILPNSFDGSIKPVGTSFQSFVSYRYSKHPVFCAPSKQVLPLFVHVVNSCCGAYSRIVFCPVSTRIPFDMTKEEGKG